MAMIEGHAGEQAVAALSGFGTDVMFTLNGGHIWPLYDAARNQGMRVIDTRHEQSATFAAEAYAKLTRRPGFAALTAGPGITNGVSAVTSAHFNGSPVVVLGGRAPQGRWGAGSLQELDHVPILASITKSAATVTDPAQAGTMVHEAARLAIEPHRGPTFLDFPLDVFGPSAGDVPAVDASAHRGVDPDPADVAALATLIAGAQRPAFIVGSDVYWDGAWTELAAAAAALGCLPITISRSCGPAECSSSAPTSWWCSARRSISGSGSGRSVRRRWHTWSTPSPNAPLTSRC
jgi:thiamine pyrophosphate-dependent acetolactate synthase large subunit-like protein